MPRRRPVFRAAYARGLAALLGVAMLAGVFVPPAAAKPYGGGLNCEGIMGVSCVVAPTGLSNDSVPIQAAINAASQATNASNAEVYLPAGTYNIGSTVTVPASVQLRGAGAATILQPTSALSGPALSTTANSVTIANLAVAGNQGVATSSTDCLQATGGTDLAISNVAVSNCKRDGIRLSGVTRANLAGVTASTNQANGIDVLGASSYVSLVDPTVFDNNKASGTGGVAVAGTSVATSIANLVAYDDQGGSATQLYPLAEGGTADYTVMSNLYASGNVTSNTPSLTGAHSQNGSTTFSQPTISGACPTASGQLGFAANQLCVGASAAAHNVVTADQAQTLTSKTLTSPVIGGGGGTAAGTVGYTATGKYQFGDGTTNQLLQLGAWTSWTPAVAQNGARTSTNTLSHYALSGRLQTAEANVTVTQAGSAGSGITLTLPNNCAAASNVVVGSFIYLEAGGTFRAGAALWDATNSNVDLVVDSSTNGFGANPSYATVSGDILRLTASCEI